MNVTLQEAGVLAAELRAAAMDWRPDNIRDRDVIVAPPLLAIPSVVRALAGSCIGVAGQNMHWEDEGPYTGEISATMLRELGVSHVLIGHSERRDHFNESNEVINRELKAALRHGLASILCVGDQQTLSEAMIGYWTQFAATGDPNSVAELAWAPYKSATHQFQSLLPPTPTVETTFDTNHQCLSFWNRF